jgi:hypothetical protein
VDHLVDQDLAKVKVVPMPMVSMATTTTMITTAMCRALLMRLVAAMAANQLNVTRPATSNAAP